MSKDLPHPCKPILSSKETSNDLDAEKNDGKCPKDSVDDHFITCDQFAPRLPSADS
jgi:hypothetical protein